PLTLSVSVIVALRVCGRSSLPIASSPWSMIHSVISSRAASFENVSLPSMDRPPSAGGLTSRMTFLSFAMTTLSPAAGTLPFGQVAGSDQRDCAPASCAPRMVATLTARSEQDRSERFFLLMATPPGLLGSVYQAKT